MHRVYVEGIGHVSVLLPTVIPETPDHPLVEFFVRIPKSAANGPPLDWQTLCKYGQESSALYRAYLIAAALSDNSNREGQPVKPDSPAARYVRAYKSADLAFMLGLRSHNPRQDRSRAVGIFERLATDGVIELKEVGPKYKIFTKPVLYLQAVTDSP